MHRWLESIEEVLPCQSFPESNKSAGGIAREIGGDYGDRGDWGERYDVCL